MVFAPRNAILSTVPVDPLSTDNPPAARELAQQLRSWALDVGFSEAGIVRLPLDQAERNAARFTHWIDQGHAGSMDYLSRRDEAGQLLRARIHTPFPWARSAIVCWASYQAQQPRSIDPAPPGSGWIARYAWSSRWDHQRQRQQPSDYHKVLLKRLRQIEARVLKLVPSATVRSFVDTGPVVERSLAEAAGLGWTGKNTCLIHPRLGSFSFLGVMLLSVDLPEDAPLLPAVPDHCGSCMRCIDACPTQALTSPRHMDAARCIAYLTIEHKGVLFEGLLEPMGRQIFGCDICQDVCPWNRKAPPSNDAELSPRVELVNPDLAWLASMSEAEFEAAFNGSPVRRAGFFGFMRNVAVVAGNLRHQPLRLRLMEWSESTNDGLRRAALWALSRIDHPIDHG